MPKDNLNQQNPRATEFPRESSAPALAYAAPHLVHLRDGEVVVYRRPESPLWQCRYKRQDGSWQRATTHQASLERAVAAACLLYDEARFRQKLGLAQKGCNFTELAQTTLVELRASLGAGEKRGKSSGQNRTLYALRHTDATRGLIAGTDMHTLARQMGTSISMLERHYSKLVPTLKAAQLA